VRKRILLVILSLFISTTNLADIKVQIPDGRTVLLKDNGTWEFVTDSSGNGITTETYQAMDLIDLRVDLETLKGRKVKVTGIAQYILNILLIKEDFSDTSPMGVDVSNLSREQRKSVIQNCREPKKITIYLSVAETGLIADKIEW